MSSFETFLVAALILPIVVAFLCYLIKEHAFRRNIVVIMAIILGASAYWLHTNVPLESVFLSFHGLDRIIAFLDFLLLFYILYVGIERRHKMVMALAVLQILPLAYIELFVRPDVANISTFMIDRLAVVMYLVIAVVGSLICIYAIQYMKEHSEQASVDRNSRFFFWFVIFLAAMNGLIFSNNLLWLYFFWEVTTLCSFQLIGHEDTEEARSKALHALYLNSLGGVALVAGIVVLVAGFSGQTLSLIDVTDSNLGLISPIFLLALGLFMVAAFTKAAQFPFQSWLLGAMVAPTPVSALLHSSTMVKAGVYLAVRLAPSYDGTILTVLIAIFGAFTFFAASLMAIGTDNAKEVLAYSTVANLGLIIACCGINLPLSVSAAVLLIIFHAVSKALLFMGTGVIEHRLGSRNIENMEGLGDKMPAMALLMVLGAFTMFLPPFGMLFSKWAGMASAATFPLVLVLFIAASALTTVFWTKWMGRMLASPPAIENTGALPGQWKLSGYYTFSLGMLGLGAILLALGVIPVINRLVAPALVFWYPLSLQGISGWSVAMFSWASFFHPNLALGGLSEGIFPVGLLFAVLILNFIIPWLILKPDPARVSTAYLCGENLPGSESERFVTAMEQSSDIALGGYYFTGLINDNLGKWLNWVALIILVLMIGVIII